MRFRFLIFDFDGTIIAGFSATVFIREQLRRGDLSPRDFVELMSAESTAAVAATPGRIQLTDVKRRQRLNVTGIGDVEYPHTRVRLPVLVHVLFVNANSESSTVHLLRDRHEGVRRFDHRRMIVYRSNCGRFADVRDIDDSESRVPYGSKQLVTEAQRVM